MNINNASPLRMRGASSTFAMNQPKQLRKMSEQKAMAKKFSIESVKSSQRASKPSKDEKMLKHLETNGLSLPKMLKMIAKIPPPMKAPKRTTAPGMIPNIASSQLVRPSFKTGNKQETSTTAPPSKIPRIPRINTIFPIIEVLSASSS